MQLPWSPPERPVPIPDAPFERLIALGVGVAVFAGATLLVAWAVSRFRARGQVRDEWQLDVQAARLGGGLFLLIGGLSGWWLLLDRQPPVVFWTGVGAAFGAISASIWCREVDHAFKQRYLSRWWRWTSASFSALVAAAALFFAFDCIWVAFTA